MQRPTPAFAGSSGLGRPSPSSRRLPFGCSTSGCASRAGAALPTARPRWLARCPPAGPAHSPRRGRGLPSLDLCRRLTPAIPVSSARPSSAAPPLPASSPDPSSPAGTAPLPSSPTPLPLSTSPMGSGCATSASSPSQPPSGRAVAATGNATVSGTMSSSLPSRPILPSSRRCGRLQRCSFGSRSSPPRPPPPPPPGPPLPPRRLPRARRGASCRRRSGLTGWGRLRRRLLRRRLAAWRGAAWREASSSARRSARRRAGCMLCSTRRGTARPPRWRWTRPGHGQDVW